MTDYRDPNYRDPGRPDYREPDLVTEDRPWSNATWGWIAGISAVVLLLIFAFGTGDGTRTATDMRNPPATTGQRTAPMPPVSGPTNDTPAMNRIIPKSVPTDTAPAPDAR